MRSLIASSDRSRRFVIKTYKINLLGKPPKLMVRSNEHSYYIVFVNYVPGNSPRNYISTSYTNTLSPVRGVLELHISHAPVYFVTLKIAGFMRSRRATNPCTRI